MYDVAVVLDGQKVEPAVVVAEKHKFIGMFRPPTMPGPNGSAVVLCPCGDHLKSFGQTRKHWLDGHFDVPQYVTIDWKEEVCDF